MLSYNKKVLGLVREIENEGPGGPSEHIMKNGADYQSVKVYFHIGQDYYRLFSISEILDTGEIREGFSVKRFGLYGSVYSLPKYDPPTKELLLEAIKESNREKDEDEI